MPESGPLPSLTGSPGPTDAMLLRQVQERRPEALAELYDRHAPTLLALARRILGGIGGMSDAEEVLQEVFLHVWNNAGKYDAARSSVSTWLVLIVRSRAIDRLRNRKVVERVHEAAHQEEPAGHASPEAVESVLLRERRQRVKAEMDKLPPEQRQVVEMAFFEGLSQSEIAERTGQPLGTVKTRTLLAMKKL
ncbi:MAG TPA: sigma-70 family RNA polymerase sigma factor, partial [Thermoanaerobaculia bacterium]|nr:sigma-70 family RNA polymerase sigma factor [Thermoanaerobaculia bacterium]